MLSLIYDSETGGLVPKKHSLLSAGWCVADLDSGELLKQREFFVKLPSLADYVVDPSAVEVHGISSEYAFENGVPPSVIRDQLFDDYLGCEISGGHNFSFDIGFIEHHLLNGESFRSHFGYRTLDTYTAALLLLGSQVESGQTISQILKHAKIEMGDIKGKAHSAMWDAIASARIFMYIRRLIRERSS